MTRPFTPEEFRFNLIPGNFENELRKMINMPAMRAGLGPLADALARVCSEMSKAHKAEHQARQARYARRLRTIDEMEKFTDETDTDEIWADVFRGLDENRP